MFALACDALVRERDRVFLERVAKDYNLSFEELSAKYLEASESAIKVPRKYTKKPKDVTVVTEPKAPKAPKEPKVKAEKQCCTAQTSKKEPCKFSCLKGEVFCLRHLKQSRGETSSAEPKVPKAKKAVKTDPVHNHPIDQTPAEPCDVCEKYGDPLDSTPTEFEVSVYNKKTCLKVIETEGESEDLKEHLAYCEEEVERTKPKPLTATQRLAAMLAEADSDSESDDEAGSLDMVEEEAFEED